MSRQKMKSEDFSANNDRVLFTVKDRSIITKECIHSAERWWKGTRKGFSITIMYSPELPEASRIEWSVCIKRKWHEGKCSMISEAMELVEQKVANRDLDARTEV